MNKMGQGEVLKALEENGDMTEKEIAEKLGVRVTSVCDCLNRLIKGNEVEREKKKEFHHCRHSYYIFRIKVEKKK